MGLIFTQQRENETLTVGYWVEKERAIIARIRLQPISEDEEWRYPDGYRYNGEFGFDWLDINPHNGNIEKLQGNAFSAIKHFYSLPKDESNQEDVGNIVSITVDNKEELINRIKSNYPEILQVGEKYADQPYLLMKKGQEITLSLEIEYLDETPRGKDTLKIKGNGNYTFEIEGGEKEGQIAQISLEPKIIKEEKSTEDKSKKNKNATHNSTNKVNNSSQPISTFNLKIKCTGNTYSEEGENFPIKLEMEGGKEIVIGGITMMQNTPLELTFRVIALVANDGDMNANAIYTLHDFKFYELTSYLNENSLNQAGFVIKIENQESINNLDSANLNEYCYAFDSEEWQSRGIFIPNYTNQSGRQVLALRKEDNNGINIYDIAINEYNKKLENLGKPAYKNGIIILAQYENSGKTGGFSQTIPVDHFGIFIYASTTTLRKSKYAHEMGHLLGLVHTFYKDDEEKSFKDQKKYHNDILASINKINSEDFRTYRVIYTRCKKQTLTNALEKCNQVMRSEKQSLNIAKQKINAVNSRQLTYNNKLTSKEAD